MLKGKFDYHRTDVWKPRDFEEETSGLLEETSALRTGNLGASRGNLGTSKSLLGSEPRRSPDKYYLSYFYG